MQSKIEFILKAVWIRPVRIIAVCCQIYWNSGSSTFDFDFNIKDTKNPCTPFPAPTFPCGSPDGFVDPVNGVVVDHN
jgi:hypothetical protein